LNKQQKGDSRGIEWTDYTHNPFRGCKHGCTWLIDGKIAECYAKTIADGDPQRYPDGFASPQYLADKLDEPKHLKKHARIFVNSMADTFGHWNSKNQIDHLLDVIKYCHWHDFQLLTKAAPRLKNWTTFPVNAWIGASVPPSAMNDQILTPSQQAQNLAVTLQILKDTNATIKWMSVEPLAWDCAGIFDRVQPMLDWVVIGAATRGREVYQPRPDWISDLIYTLHDQGTRIFFKGNLRGNPAADPWLEEMPIKYVERRAALDRIEQEQPIQGALF
jgi:protein gp37